MYGVFKILHCTVYYCETGPNPVDGVVDPLCVAMVRKFFFLMANAFHLAANTHAVLSLVKDLPLVKGTYQFPRVYII